ncbi:hypothetical protein BD410DRAFT_782939 [Rickenella mellea]|uniref:Amidohydrolase 3 domain-containing protein n=1 Tax=Rickenella mellea TaxID=50990 RepID=A0A4Y7QHE5_9AGAM|nr:hypothetical protein BD410DRAFT_782939 [Rickenella mellea]
MSELRRRGDKTAMKKQTNFNGPPSPSRTSPMPQPRRGRVVAMFIALLGGLMMLFLSRMNASKLFPESYVICSREGRVYTVDDSKPQVECLAVHGVHVLDTGSIDEMRNKWGDRDKTGPTLGALRSMRDGLKFYFIKSGHSIVPGLADAHAHVMEYGWMRQLDLDGPQSVSEVISKVKEYIHSHPDVGNDTSAWIEGWGWDQTKWPGAEFPTASDLDEDPLLHGRLIALRRIDGHATWVSPKVLEVMGELPATVDGGVIVRNSEGLPTGIFLDNAMALIPQPQWDEQDMLKFFATTVQEALANGLTSIHDAWTTPPMIKFFKRMAEQDKIPLRLYLMGNVESEEYWGAEIPKLENYGTAGRLNLRSVKLFSDGALGSWGAALLEPYTDKPDTTGILRSDPKVYSNLIESFFRDDFQVNVHCIGDRANNVILDIFEDLLRRYNATERRPRIEHAQILTLQDLERMGRLGVIPSVQPTHATSDMWYAEARLGPERIKGAYAYRTQLENSPNNVLPIGSDFPVEGINPLLGFYAAVTRLSTDGQSPHGPGGWFSEQRLTRAEALKGMTLDAAYASFAEKDLGSLTPGKRADFVVFDDDIMTASKERILSTKVRATVIDGRPLYGFI